MPRWIQRRIVRAETPARCAASSTVTMVIVVMSLAMVVSLVMTEIIANRDHLGTTGPPEVHGGNGAHGVYWRCMTDTRQCAATNKDGSACRATPRPGTNTCPWHDPSLSEDRARWKVASGKAKSNRRRAAKKYAEGALEPDQLQGIIGATLVGVLGGRIAPNVANAVAALARTSIAIAEAVETEERLAALERRAGLVGRDQIA